MSDFKWDFQESEKEILSHKEQRLKSYWFSTKWTKLTQCFWMKLGPVPEIQCDGKCRCCCLFVLTISVYFSSFVSLQSQHQIKWNETFYLFFEWWWNVLSERRSRTIAKYLFIHLLKLFNRTKNASLNKMYEGFFHFLYKSITKGRHFRSWCFVEFEHANVHFRSCWNEHHFIDFINVVEGVREPVWLYI